MTHSPTHPTRSCNATWSVRCLSLSLSLSGNTEAGDCVVGEHRIVWLQARSGPASFCKSFRGVEGGGVTRPQRPNAFTVCPTGGGRPAARPSAPPVRLCVTIKVMPAMVVCMHRHNSPQHPPGLHPHGADANGSAYGFYNRHLLYIGFLFSGARTQY